MRSTTHFQVIGACVFKPALVGRIRQIVIVGLTANATYVELSWGTADAIPAGQLISGTSPKVGLVSGSVNVSAGSIEFDCNIPIQPETRLTLVMAPDFEAVVGVSVEV